MPFRQVTRARKSAGQFAGHARQHAWWVAVALTERLGGAPEGQQVLDVNQLQIRIGDELDRMHERLLAHDDEHAGELQTDRELRQHRDRWYAELREIVLQIKSILDAYHGPGASQKVFKEDPRMPMDPAAMYQLTRRIHSTLSDPGFHLPGTQQGVAVNLRVLAQRLEEPMHGLGATLVALDDSQSQTKRTQSQKDALLAETVAFNGDAIRFLEALYALAGHQRLANRLRNSRHLRPGEPPEPGSEPDEGAPAADAAGEAPAVAATPDEVSPDVPTDDDDVAPEFEP